MSERTWRWAAPSVALLALAASIAGIANGFTYDDRYIVEMNPTMKGLAGWWRVFASPYWPLEWGGDGYRPLTILAFKLEYAIGRGSPVAFHATNILLYALVSVLVFRLAAQLFDREHRWAAWLSAALFAVHPVHVEAVANVVGQSELLVAGALLTATLLYVRDRRAGPLRPATTAWILLLYALACFAKEHAIVLPALLGAAEVIVVRDAEPWRARVSRLRPFFLLTVLVAVSFVWVRSLVLSDHSIGGFQPFTPFSSLRITNADRMLTALGVVPQWLRLLYWPAHLSSEYGPPDVEIAQGPSVTQLPGLALLVAVLAFAFVLRKRQPIVTFGIAFVCIVLAPSSNFLLPAGIVLAERTLFLPSVGAMLVAGAVAVIVATRWESSFAERPSFRTAAWAMCAVVLAAGVARSARRSTVWRENDRLFRQAVVDSPLSYRAHYMLGAWHFENGRKREGEASYRRALNLFPYDPFLSYNMAEQYRLAGLCGPAIPLYRWTFGLNAQFPLGRAMFASCLLDQGFYDEARARAFDAIRNGADLKRMRWVILVTDSIRDSGKSSPVAQRNGIGKAPDSMQKAARSEGDRRGG